MWNIRAVSMGVLLFGTVSALPADDGDPPATDTTYVSYYVWNRYKSGPGFYDTPQDERYKRNQILIEVNGFPVFLVRSTTSGQRAINKWVVPGENTVRIRSRGKERFEFAVQIQAERRREVARITLEPGEAEGTMVFEADVPWTLEADELDLTEAGKRKTTEEILNIFEELAKAHRPRDLATLRAMAHKYVLPDVLLYHSALYFDVRYGKARTDRVAAQLAEITFTRTPLPREPEEEFQFIFGKRGVLVYTGIWPEWPNDPYLFRYDEPRWPYAPPFIFTRHAADWTMRRPSGY